MEHPVEKSAEHILKQPGVVGVACLDKNGLCCAAKGTTLANEAAKDSFGVYKAISRRASQISANSGIPIVKIEVEPRASQAQAQSQSSQSQVVKTITVKDHEDMTIVVHRN